MSKFIYMDSGATSWPKPRAVIEEMTRAMTEYGANPGRGAYAMALQAATTVFQARQVLTEFFNGSNPQRMVFTANTTDGINMALYGLLKAGDHVLYSPLEHNAAWRPVMTMARDNGVEAEMILPGEDGRISAAAVEKQLKPNTKMVVCAHASNITGTVQPIEEIGALVRRHDLLFLVDAAQSAGILPVDIQAMNIDLLAAPGHKSLYGPMGTGILYVGERADAIRPVKQGGTGSKSHECYQPESFPDRLECGTVNLPGVAGLKAAIEYFNEVGVEKIMADLADKTQYLLRGLSGIPKVSVYGPPAGVSRTSLVAINVDGVSSNQLAFVLDREYNIAVRAGFHCAPLGHKLMGTSDEGAVRFGLGRATTYEDLDFVIKAVAEIAADA
ncbi:MAG: aminotransferase class V-fold PLP-dependent enzyme [Bacillota bacterium]